MKIIGSGSALPDQVVTNDDLCKILDTSDEWIVTHTGISSRRILKDETVYELGALAAKRALEEANADAESVDLMICSNVISDHVTPAPGCFIAGALGYTGQTLDINGACTGFLKALDADSAIRAGKARRVLIIAAEQPSALCDWTDRSSCILFGDGAGAAVFGPVDKGFGLLSFDLGSDGAGGDLLDIPAGGSQKPLTAESLLMHENCIHMDGRAVFRFAVKILGETVEKSLERAGIEKTEIDWLVPHQANTRIIDAAAKRLELPAEKVIVDIGKYGNMSAASIPVALAEAVQAHRFKKGDLIALAGFGAGLTWASCIMKWAKED